MRIAELFGFLRMNRMENSELTIGRLCRQLRKVYMVVVRVL